MSKRNVVQRIREEEEDSYSDDSLFRITSYGADLSFRELIARYEDEELLKPELQRNYVWDRIEASRFIDSILLGLPVPSIFLAQQADEKLLIVDGYQRIMTVYDFVRGVFSRDGRVFRLSRTNRIHERWRGQAFSELYESDQRKIRNTTIHAIIFVQHLPEGDDTSLFQVFERINTSGRTLMPQEIRNCVAQGRFNRLLFDLNAHGHWRELFGLSEPEARMRDMEFVLRFFALSSPTYRQDDRERISLKRFLDLYMKNNKDMDEDECERLKQRFINAVELIFETFGSQAFHNVSPSNPDKLVEKFSPTLFDSMMIAADHAIETNSLAIAESPEAARREMLSDEEYRFAVTKETMSRNCINTRVSKASRYLFGAVYEQR